MSLYKAMPATVFPATEAEAAAVFDVADAAFAVVVTALEEACEDARHQLLVAIGGYDLALKEVRDYYNEHHDQLDRCVAWRPSRLETSHRLIEKAYNVFHKGN